MVKIQDGQVTNRPPTSPSATARPFRVGHQLPAAALNLAASRPNARGDSPVKASIDSRGDGWAVGVVEVCYRVTGTELEDRYSLS